MTIHKHPLVPDRIRRPPNEGWSWIDRRFLRQYAASLERDAVLLYFFLAAVSDKHGLSYYSDTVTACRLRMSETAVVRARHQLEHHNLIAYEYPLYQVLSLPSSRRRSGNSAPTCARDTVATPVATSRTDAPQEDERRSWRQIVQERSQR